MANVFNFVVFSATWSIVIFLFLILWLAVPCNPNLNCTPSTKRKDGTKAFLVAFLITYGILFVVAVAARFFICTSDKPKTDAYGGGILTNIESLFKMNKVPVGGSHAKKPFVKPFTFLRR